jgi:PAS domain S-box-containing protein
MKRFKINSFKSYLRGRRKLLIGLVGILLLLCCSLNQASGLALRILAGENADELPIVDRDFNKYQFDNQELLRFDISQKALPKNSVIINQQHSVFSFTKKQLFKVLGVLAGLVLGVLFLLKNVYSRYSTEKALREVQTRFHGYFDLNLVGMVTMSASSKWLELNDKFCEMVKYSRAELQKKSWIDLTHPDDLAEAYEQFEALCAGEMDLVARDKRYVCKDGSIVHVQLSTRALRHPDGRIDRLVSIVQDITKRKVAEAALRLDEARLEALLALNQMGDASVEEIINFIVSSVISLTKSKIGYLAFVNKADGTLIKHGWTRGVLQECTLKKAATGYPIEKAGLWAEAVRHRKPIIINDYAFPALVKKGLPGGHTPIKRFLGVPLLEQDKVVAVIGVGNKAEKYNDADIRQLSLLGQGLVHLIESKRSERGLRESQQEYKRLYRQFQALLDSIPDPIFLLTPDMNIVWSNKGAALHLRLNVRELPGKSCCSLWTGHAESCPECPIARCFKSGKAEEQTLTFLDGRIWGVKAFPLKNAKGEVENVIKMAVDITEKIKLRDEAERTARLASLGELAAGVAHEINNPNGVLMLNAKVLTDFFAEALPMLPGFFRGQGVESLAGLDCSEMATEIPLLLTDMQDNSKRISRIVKDLKQFVRSEAKPSLDLLDLNEVVRIAMRLTGNTLKRSTSNYEVRQTPYLPRVRGNFQQLEQVIVNLLINACQALEDQKAGIYIATYFDAAQGLCVVEVRDEGGGIDPQVLPRITEPFITTRRQEGGTGLGLSVSARIVREHSGKLEFFSVLGEGTTVRLALPSVCEGEIS